MISRQLVRSNLTKSGDLNSKEFLAAANTSRCTAFSKLFRE